jgi:signal transduction histidine kinase
VDRTTNLRASRLDRRRRLTALAIGGLLISLLAAISLVFSSAAGAARVAEASRHLQWANATSASAGIARAAVAQSVVFGIDRALGVADEAAVDAAVAEAREALETYSGWVAAAPGDVDADTVAALTAIGDESAGVVDLVASGRPVAADLARTEGFESAFAAGTDDLRIMQLTLADEVASAETAAGRVAVVTRTLVTLLVPVAALLVYRALARNEMKRRQAGLVARVEAAEELNRSKDEFIAGISHELRTPLTSIYGFSQHLLDHGILDPNEALELIALINHDSSELSRMVEDLLTAARIDASSLQVDAATVSVLKEVHTVIAPLLRAGNDISVSGSHETAFADRARVRQVVRNLVSNAVKHGGPRVEITVTRKDDTVLVIVADSGPGVGADIEPRMFDRFVHDGRSTILTGSVGLGLAVSRSLAQHMGGNVTYHRRGGWSTFTLELPLAPSYLTPFPSVVLSTFETPARIEDEVELALIASSSRPSRLDPDVRIRFE